MLSDINENVDVIAVFRGNKAYPRIVRWNERDYKITNINMRHEVMMGETLVHYFSVSDKSNYFKLAFNTKNLQWRLEQVYNEG